MKRRRIVVPEPFTFFDVTQYGKYYIKFTKLQRPGYYTLKVKSMGKDSFQYIPSKTVIQKYKIMVVQPPILTHQVGELGTVGQGDQADWYHFVTLTCLTDNVTMYYKIDDGKWQIYKGQFKIYNPCKISTYASKGSLLTAKTRRQGSIILGQDNLLDKQWINSEIVQYIIDEIITVPENFKRQDGYDFWATTHIPVSPGDTSTPDFRQ